MVGIIIMDIARKILQEEGYVAPEHQNLQPAQPTLENPATPAVPTPEAVILGAEAQPAPETPETPAAPAPATPQANTENPAPEAIVTPEVPETPIAAAIPQEEMDEASLLEILSKKLGRTVSSLEDLQPKPELTDAEKIAQQEKLRDEAISFGIKENLITRKDIENYSVDAAKDPRAVALELFTAQLKGTNPAITDEEINEHFTVWVMENEPEDSPLRILKQNEIKNVHQNYLNSKYSNLLGIENGYSEYNTAIQQAQQYKTTVERSMVPFENNGQPYQMSFEVGEDKHSYSYKVKPETIAAIKTELLGQNMFNAIGKDGTDPIVVGEYIKNAILIKELPRLLNEIAESHKSRAILDQKAGRQGVKPEREVLTGPTDAPTSGMSRIMKSILAGES